MDSDPSENVCAVNNCMWEAFHLQCSSKSQRPVHPGSQTPSMYTYMHTYCSTTLGLTTSWINPSNAPSAPFLGEIHSSTLTNCWFWSLLQSVVQGEQGVQIGHSIFVFLKWTWYSHCEDCSNILHVCPLEWFRKTSMGSISVRDKGLLACAWCTYWRKPSATMLVPVSST